MKLLNTHSNGGTCDRCGKGIVNVAVFLDGKERMEVGLDCALKLTSADFPTAKAIKAEMKAAREISAFKRAVNKGHYYVEIPKNTPFYLRWSDAKSGHYVLCKEAPIGIQSEYRDLVLSYAKEGINYAL